MREGRIAEEEVMPTITVPRPGLTTEEVVGVLRAGLPPDYNVLPGMAIGQLAIQGIHQGKPNTIVVGTGGNRIVKAQVTINPQGERTELRIRPGGITLDLLVNIFGVARDVREVLSSSFS
jgi:hypothetical protein